MTSAAQTPPRPSRPSTNKRGSDSTPWTSTRALGRFHAVVAFFSLLMPRREVVRTLARLRDVLLPAAGWPSAWLRPTSTTSRCRFLAYRSGSPAGRARSCGAGHENPRPYDGRPWRPRRCQGSITEDRYRDQWDDDPPEPILAAASLHRTSGPGGGRGKRIGGSRLGRSASVLGCDSQAGRRRRASTSSFTPSAMSASLSEPSRVSCTPWAEAGLFDPR
jgi:hypothetical protein